MGFWGPEADGRTWGYKSRHAKITQKLHALWDTTIPDGQLRYYLRGHVLKPGALTGGRAQNRLTPSY